MSDDLSLIGGAWTAYNPTINTGGVTITLGNGSIDAAFKLVGDKTVFWRVSYVVGSSTIMTAGNVTVGLPTPAKSTATGHALGVYATSGPLSDGVWRNISTTTVALFSGSSQQTVASLGLVSGSVLFLNGTYEGA